MIATKTNKNEVEEQRRKDYNQIYDNCLQLISNRVALLKVMEHYLEDSQITGGIFRIMRKLIQVLTYDTSPLIDKSKNAKVFSKEFRVN